MNPYKAAIIITALKENEKELGFIKGDWEKQIDSLNDITVDDNYDRDRYQIEIHFGHKSQIPEIYVPSIEVDGIITVSIIEATFISAIIVKDKILKQVDHVRHRMAKCEYDDTYIVSFCFENKLPSFIIYDKNR